jgi:hypothetical protein
MQEPTGVTIVRLVNSQVTTSSPKTEDAHSSARHVIQIVRSNSVNNNAINANNVVSDRLSTVPPIVALHQDQHVIAINN